MRTRDSAHAPSYMSVQCVKTCPQLPPDLVLAQYSLDGSSQRGNYTTLTNVITSIISF
jgi:hypothetical protein